MRTEEKDDVEEGRGKREGERGRRRKKKEEDREDQEEEDELKEGRPDCLTSASSFPGTAGDLDDPWTFHPRLRHRS